jgi:hypothetical protein
MSKNGLSKEPDHNESRRVACFMLPDCQQALAKKRSMAEYYKPSLNQLHEENDRNRRKFHRADGAVGNAGAWGDANGVVISKRLVYGTAESLTKL